MSGFGAAQHREMEFGVARDNFPPRSYYLPLTTGARGQGQAEQGKGKAEQGKGTAAKRKELEDTVAAHKREQQLLAEAAGPEEVD